MNEILEKNTDAFAKQQVGLLIADPVEITYFTDPLCCWSWAMEPQWRRLRYAYNGYITWNYVMGGLLSSWSNFDDTVNNITRPAQMGPLWMQASHISGMPIHKRVWVNNPPASSYPACIAVKCAQLQSNTAGEQMLRLLRERIMIKGEDISQQNVLIDAAKELGAQLPSFDLSRFQNDLFNDNGLEAFRIDLHKIQTQNIQRFPAFIFRRQGYKPLLLSGYKPYDLLLKAFKQVASDLPEHIAATTETYNSFWGNTTEKELQEATASL